MSLWTTLLKPFTSAFARMSRAPNPIWMREMRQTARVGRTPWILFVLTLSIAMLLCMIGGAAASEKTSPATIGETLFQVFFSIAYFITAFIGPAVASSSLASEREGRTWESVLLTGLSTKEIARGKFLASYTIISLYLVALAPVGALPFLFGGITATECVLAFILLFFIAALAVAFGLAVSSVMSSVRGAVAITQLLAMCAAPFLFALFGFGTSVLAHNLWPDVARGLPIWLPTAYVRAPFGVDYVIYLIALPLFFIAIPAWFLYECTIANLMSPSDDRSTGLKVWCAVSTPLVAFVCVLPCIVASDTVVKTRSSVVGVILFILYSSFCALMFAGDPLEPSRRVRLKWDRAKAGAFRRFFGPNLSYGTLFSLAVGLLGTIAICLVSIATISPVSGGSYGREFARQIVIFASHLLSFFVFVLGTMATARVRGGSAWTARIVTAFVVVFATVAPWVIVVLASSSEHRIFDSRNLVLGAPSPLFAIPLFEALDSTTPASRLTVTAALVSQVMWLVLGLTLLATSMRHASQLIAKANAERARTGASETSVNSRGIAS